MMGQGTCDPLEGSLTNDTIADTLELLHLADAYVIPSLKERCEVSLQVRAGLPEGGAGGGLSRPRSARSGAQRVVDTDTAARLLERAELANAHQLADFCRHVLKHGMRWDML